MTEEQQNLTARLTEGSLVSVSILFVVGSGIAAGAAWATNISSRLSGIERTLDDGVRDRWRGSDMDAWVRAFNSSCDVWRLYTENELKTQGVVVKIPQLVAPKPSRHGL